jgi:hypothetical protein
MSVPIDVTPDMEASPILKSIMLPLLRHTTDWFIRDTATIAGPVNIALKRQVSVDKPGGGRDFTTLNIPSQVFRLTNQTTSSGINYSSNDDGMVRTDQYVLIGKHDADVKMDDTWTDKTGQWKVMGLVPHNGYETRAVVTAYTTDPDYGS